MTVGDCAMHQNPDQVIDQGMKYLLTLSDLAL
jgi:hypothetical protein